MIELFAQTEAAAGFGQFLLIGLVIGSLYALIALGYTMVYGIIELINFAHGDLFMLGSFLALQLAIWVAVTTAAAGTAADRWHGRCSCSWSCPLVLRCRSTWQWTASSTSRSATHRNWPRSSRPSASASSS